MNSEELLLRAVMLRYAEMAKQAQLERMVRDVKAAGKNKPRPGSRVIHAFGRGLVKLGTRLQQTA